MNCLWLQEQCAKKLVPLEKIPGESNQADLMTKHLTQLMIKRHVDGLNLEFRSGRSEKAAKLHSLHSALKKERQATADIKLDRAGVAFSESAGGDYWSERGERGRWVRIHTTPRTVDFLPWKVARGPGRKTRLSSVRSTRGVDVNGHTFEIKDDWTNAQSRNRPRWTGRTIFLVDRAHTDEWGTDQRRQRDEVANFSEARTPTWTTTTITDEYDYC